MSHMDRALSLARTALGSVSPNAAVGAVVVRDGTIVGEGYTQPPGGAHAEVMAIRQAGAKASGATLYVTLEPCSHHGRTPPCAKAVVEAGIAEVHVSVIDPNPLVDGSGLALLERAGVRTHVGDGAEVAREVMESFLKFITTDLPFVTAKYAVSMDGKAATRTGDSKWISGEEARRYVHQMRTVSDAIMVGVNTVLADDPRLTARDADDASAGRQPLRVVVDSRGRTPPSARLLSQPGESLIVVARPGEAAGHRLAEAGAEVKFLPAENGSVDLARLLEVLGQRSITSVLVEGGGTLLGALFDRGLVDKVTAFIAPTIIGGREAPGPIEGVGSEQVANASRLERVNVMRFGRDVAIVGYCGETNLVHRNS